MIFERLNIVAMNTPPSVRPTDEVVAFVCDAFRVSPWGLLSTREDATQTLIDIYGAKGFYGVFVRDQSDQLVGMALASSEVINGDKQTTLCTVCVGPSFRKKGIGRLLLNNVIQESRSRGCQTLLLWTKARTIVQGYYKKVGFMIDEERVSPQHPEWCPMRLDLQTSSTSPRA